MNLESSKKIMFKTTIVGASLSGGSLTTLEENKPNLYFFSRFTSRIPLILWSYCNSFQVFSVPGLHTHRGLLSETLSDFY